MPLRVGIALAFERGRTSGFSGFLRLEVPLDRVARPTLLSEPAEPESDEETEAEKPSEPARERVRVPLSLAARVDSAFVRALVREAVRLRGYPLAHSRLDGLDTRARVAALLPQLSLRAVRSTDQSLRLTPTGAERYDFTQTGGDDLLLEARATWDLDRLVFASEGLRVEQLRGEYAEAADRLTLLVLRHVFAWHQARARLFSQTLEPEAELSAELELFEAETALEVLTNGFFGRLLAQRARNPPRAALGPGQAAKKE